MKVPETIAIVAIARPVWLRAASVDVMKRILLEKANP
jgi:hypothetical protein